MKINELFRLSRILTGVKQYILAESVGITRQAIQRFECGRSTLSRHKLRQIAPILNINPDFLDDQSINPYKGRGLIKMFFHEEGASHMIPEPVNILVTSNDELKFISLLSNFDIRTLTVESLSLFVDPIYAVVVMDKSDNVFLLRRRANTNYIKLDGKLYMAVWSVVETPGNGEKSKSMYFATKKISHDLHKKIKEWSVERTDIEPLFFECEFARYTEPTEDEAKIILATRDLNIGSISKIELLILKELREKRVNTDEIISWIETLEDK